MRTVSSVALVTALAVFAPACGGDDNSGDDDGVGGADGGVGPDGPGSCVGDECPDDLGPLGEGMATFTGAAEAGAEDGVRGVARLSNPVNVAVRSDGVVYIADFDNGRIRVATPEGDVATLTQRADFERPFGLALSRDEKTLYVQTDVDDLGENDASTGTVWKVDVGSGYASVLARHVGRPRGLAVLADGRLVLSDYLHHTVRLMNAQSGAVTPLAGAADQAGFADGDGGTARFNAPYDVVVDSNGDLLVADMKNHRIRRVTLLGRVTTFAGSGGDGWRDGPAGTATFSHPQALAIDDGDVLYVTDAQNYRVRRVMGGQVSTVAGDGQPGFLNGDPLTSRLFGLEGLDITADGDLLFIADGNRGEDEPFNRIRRLKF